MSVITTSHSVLSRVSMLEEHAGGVEDCGRAQTEGWKLMWVRCTSEQRGTIGHGRYSTQQPHLEDSSPSTSHSLARRNTNAASAKNRLLCCESARAREQPTVLYLLLLTLGMRKRVVCDATYGSTSIFVGEENADQSIYVADCGHSDRIYAPQASWT